MLIGGTVRDLAHLLGDKDCMVHRETCRLNLACIIRLIITASLV